jgi:hypothetical protein
MIFNSCPLLSLYSPSTFATVEMVSVEASIPFKSSQRVINRDVWTSVLTKGRHMKVHTNLDQAGLSLEKAIVHDGPNLFLNKARRRNMDILHAEGVLSRQGRRGRHRKAAMGRECLLVCLETTAGC